MYAYIYPFVLLLDLNRVYTRKYSGFVGFLTSGPAEFSLHTPGYFQSWNPLTFHKFRHFENLVLNTFKTHLSRALRRGERQAKRPGTYC